MTMMDLLKKLYVDIENLRGKKLALVLVIIFIVFTFIGVSIGYFTGNGLKENETGGSRILLPRSNPVDKVDSFEGRVAWIDPKMYPKDNVSYALYDKDDKEIVLLKALDKKLELLEGFYVKVNGKLLKSADGKKDILLVSEVIMNAAN